MTLCGCVRSEGFLSRHWNLWKAYFVVQNVKLCFWAGSSSRHCKVTNLVKCGVSDLKCSKFPASVLTSLYMLFEKPFFLRSTFLTRQAVSGCCLPSIRLQPINHIHLIAIEICLLVLLWALSHLPMWVSNVLMLAAHSGVGGERLDQVQSLF